MLKKKTYKTGLILAIALLILFVFYKVSYLTHTIAPEVCFGQITVDGILDEPDWNLEKKEVYLGCDPKFKSSTFAKFQFLRDSIHLYFGLQFYFDSTLTGRQGDILRFTNSRDAWLDLEIEFDSKTSRKKGFGVDFEFEQKNKKGDITSKSGFDNYDSRPTIFENIKMQQNYSLDTWNIELSIPIDLMLEENEKYIAFQMDMYGYSNNDSHVSIHMDYPYSMDFFFKKYIVLKNLD